MHLFKGAKVILYNWSMETPGSCTFKFTAEVKKPGVSVGKRTWRADADYCLPKPGFSLGHYMWLTDWQSHFLGSCAHQETSWLQMDFSIDLPSVRRQTLVLPEWAPGVQYIGILFLTPISYELGKWELSPGKGLSLNKINSLNQLNSFWTVYWTHPWVSLIRYSRSVWSFSSSSFISTHPSTNQTPPCFASKIRWDWAHSEWYNHRLYFHILYLRLQHTCIAK